MGYITLEISNMKKLCIVLLLMLSIQLQAQIKEGSIKFSMSVEGGDDGGMANAMMSGSTITLYFKKEKTLAEMVSQLYNMRTLTDSKSTLVLMDAMGQKLFSRKNNTAPDKSTSTAKETGPAITYTKEKKKILGFDCSKAIVEVKNNKSKGSQIIAWFTEKIQSNSGLGLISPEILASLKGMVLEIEMTQGAIKTKMVAKEISVKPVPDAVFALSTAGYTERKMGKQ